MRLKSVKKPLFIISSLGSLFLSLLMTEGYQTMGPLGALLGYSLGAVQEVGPLLAGKGGKRAPKQPSTLRPKFAQKWENMKSYSTGEQIFKEVYSNPIEMQKGKGWTEASIVLPGNKSHNSTFNNIKVASPFTELEKKQIRDQARGGFPEHKLLLNKHGEKIPYPEAKGVAHTQLGIRESKVNKQYTVYRQAREFDKNGKLVKDIDFTDHGKPGIHTNPHEHPYLPNPTGGSLIRGDALPLNFTSGINKK